MCSIDRERILSVIGLILAAGVGLATLAPTAAAREAWLKLQGQDVRIAIAQDFSLTVFNDAGATLWKTHPTSKPSLGVTKGDAAKADDANEPLELDKAGKRHVEPFDDGQHRGHKIVLSDFPGVDVQVELVLALSPAAELLVEVEKTAGRDTVRRVTGLYSWLLEPDAASYALAPLGSGYMIRADSPAEISLRGFVGSAYSLPLFGIVRGDHCCYEIIETWWDANVSVKNTPGQGVDVALDWEPSLEKLAYRRRVLVRFAKGLDHVGIAKAYRRYLIERGEFSTLSERARKLPALKKFLAGVEYRWTHREPARPNEEELVLENIRRFQAAGIPLTFFYPKWPQKGYSQLLANSAWWQAALLEEPTPGGWPAIVGFADKVRELGCTIKVMVTPHPYVPLGPAYDATKATGLPFPQLSLRYAAWGNGLFLDRLQQHGLPYDALYFDGYSAHNGFPEHRDAQGPVSRRESYEAQLACFRQTRARGIVPGGELARFWSIGPCDFFFFTDWARDRLRSAEPLPLVPLVFHDCYAAHFSGGGYYNEGKHDWYADRHPRLYELMYAAMPSHNWLPAGSRPVERKDWDMAAMSRRLDWLRLWHAFYQKVCYAEMLSHAFLNPERTLQQVRFAGNITADFDLAQGRFRVRGVPGFSGDWQTPPNIPGSYGE